VKSGKSKHQCYGYGYKISLIHRCSFHFRIALAALLVRAAAPKRIPVTASGLCAAFVSLLSRRWD
jgi:hypothetical protein